MTVHETGDLLPGVYGRWLERSAPDMPPSLRRAIEQLLAAVQDGHICIHLEPADREDWYAGGWVGRPGDYRPFIVEDDRFYLARYWDHEQTVAGRLRQHAHAEYEIADDVLLKRTLAKLFPADAADRQRLAALVAQFKALTLISGGPGTGKTTTVVKLLALLLEQNPRLRIGLAAPTGKAAQRLAEAIGGAKARLDIADATRTLIPESANTLHRLLGALGDTGRFRHGLDNPLALDVLVIDEASMIDLALMRYTLDALLPETRLILLGDRDQLASVEAGSVFGDICAYEGFSAPFLARLQPFDIHETARANVPAPGDCRVELTQSYRFHAASGIGALARASRAGDVPAFGAAFEQGFADIEWLAASQGDSALRARIQAGFEPYAQAIKQGDPATAFAAFLRFRLLCAHRSGPAGVEGLNRMAESALGLPATNPWYEGRPVLITANDYVLRLFNGDLGLCLRIPEGLRVFFENGAGQHRSLLPGRLPAHETAYAMTVHKSQGSEFEEVLLVLPEQITPVLNRPLIYTAITRARQRFQLWGRQEVLAAALASLPQRESGLTGKLRD